jgi:hypothetical protein
MVPPKLGSVGVPKICVTIGKITWPTILDLGSSVSTIPKSLGDHLDLPRIEKCNIDLLHANSSTRKALDRVNDVLLEFHMTFFTY